MKSSQSMMLELPDSFIGTPEKKQLIELAFEQRLGGDVSVAWRFDNHPMYAVATRLPDWPGRVLFSEVIPLMLACKPGTILMGLTRDGKPFYRSFTGDTPHWGVHVNTGFGKSTMLCVTGAQILRAELDSTLICIDPKEVSLTPLIGIPGVTVYNDMCHVEAMWSGVERHWGIVEQRMSLMRDDPTIKFPTQVLLLDELGMFALLTSMRWNEIKSRRDPAIAPVWKTLAMSLMAGRQFGCYVILVAQRLDDQAIGRLGLKTLLNLKAMAGFGAQDWKRFIGTHPVPRSASTLGRWIYVDGPSQVWVQNIYTDIKDGVEVRNYAMAGRSGLLVPAASRVPHVPPQSQVRDPEQRPSGGTTQAGQDVAWAIGNEAAATYLGISIEAFRKRRQRNGEIPGVQYRGRVPMWRKVDLETWHKETMTRV